MRRSSFAALVVAASFASACHSEKLIGPEAQVAMRRAESFSPSRFDAQPTLPVGARWRFILRLGYRRSERHNIGWSS